MDDHKSTSLAKFSRGLFGTLLLAATVLLTACTQQSQERLYVGTNIWPGYEPGYIAESQGLYKTGQIQMRQFSSATEVLRAFRNDSIHVAALTLDEALQLAQNDPEIVVFLVADISDGADVIMAKPSISNVAELKGKTIAAEGTALGAFVISRALQIADIDPQSLTIESMTVDESIVAYEENRIDAVVTFEPFRSKLLRQGAKEIFNSKAIPNEIVDVLVTKRSIIDNNEETLRDFTQGWLSAIELMKTQPKITAPLLAKRMELDIAEVDGAFEGLILPDVSRNLSMLGGTNPSLIAVANSLQAVLKEKDLLSREVNSKNLFESRLLP